MIWKRYILRRNSGNGYFAGLRDTTMEDGSCGSVAVFTPEREKAWMFVEMERAQSIAGATGCNVIEVLNRNDLEPMEPDMEGGGTSWFYVRGDCHGVIDCKAEKCRHCGRPVKWEGTQWVRT